MAIKDSINTWRKGIVIPKTRQELGIVLKDAWIMLTELRPVRLIIIIGFLLVLILVINRGRKSVQYLREGAEHSANVINVRDAILLTSDILLDLAKMEGAVLGVTLKMQGSGLGAKDTIEKINQFPKAMIEQRLPKLNAIKMGDGDTLVPKLSALVRAEMATLDSILLHLKHIRKEFAAVPRATAQDTVAEANAREQHSQYHSQLAELRLRSQKNLSELQKIYHELRTEWSTSTNFNAENNQRLVRIMSIQATIVGILLLALFSTMFIVIFHDGNRNRALQARLEQEKTNAQSLAEVKQRFLANMSHEIRNPLHAVIGFAAQLFYTELNKEQRHLLKPLRQSARYLLALINDVLDYSKLDSNNLRLDRAGFRLDEVIEEVENTYRSLAEQKGIGFEAKWKEDLPLVVIGDSLRLRQMLLNLVGNAVKFTEKGKVSMEIQALPTSNQRIKLEFTIADTGIGIPSHLQEQIFSEWAQADTKTTRKFGGTGLGLSITRRLAELHGGQIMMSSEEGKGTRMLLSLPFELGTEADLEPMGPATVEIGKEFQGIKVLSADDEAYNRTLMEVILQRMGIQSDSAENGKEAWEKLQKGGYDFALLDLQMPEMDGFEVARKVRKLMGPDFPLIAVTATATKAEADLARSAGINEVVLKPFEEMSLRRTISKVLQNMKKIHPNEVEPEVRPSDTGILPEISQSDEALPQDEYQLNTLRKLVGDNPKALHTMLQVFLSSARTQAAQLQIALNELDLISAAASAHKLAPACRHLGLIQLTAALKSLELQGPELLEEGRWQEVLSSVLLSLSATITRVEDDLALLQP